MEHKRTSVCMHAMHSSATQLTDYAHIHFITHIHTHSLCCVFCVSLAHDADVLTAEHRIPKPAFRSDASCCSAPVAAADARAQTLYASCAQTSIYRC